MSAASRGAALQMLGQAIPRVTQDVIGQVQAGRDRKSQEEKDRVEADLKERRMVQQEKQGQLTDLQVEDQQVKADRRKKALELTTKIEATKSAERIKRKQKKTLDDSIAKMSPQQLDVEFGTSDIEQARQLAYTDIQLPKFGSDKDVIDSFGSEIEQMQFATPETQGIQAGRTQRIKSAEKIEAVEGAREFRVGEGDVAFDRKRVLQEDTQAHQRDLARMTIAKQERDAATKGVDQQRRMDNSINSQLKSYDSATKGNRPLARSLAKLDNLMSESGGIYGDKSIALAGVGSKAFRNWLQGSAAETRTILNQIYGLKLKEQSGAAVSDQEFTRFEKAMGAGNRDTEASFRTAIQNMAELTYGQLANAEKSLIGPAAQKLRDSGKESARLMGFIPEHMQDEWINQPIDKEFIPDTPLPFNEDGTGKSTSKTTIKSGPAFLMSKENKTLIDNAWE